MRIKIALQEFPGIVQWKQFFLLILLWSSVILSTTNFVSQLLGSFKAQGELYSRFCIILSNELLQLPFCGDASGRRCMNPPNPGRASARRWQSSMKDVIGLKYYIWKDSFVEAVGRVLKPELARAQSKQRVFSSYKLFCWYSKVMIPGKKLLCSVHELFQSIHLDHCMHICLKGSSYTSRS